LGENGNLGFIGGVGFDRVGDFNNLVPLRKMKNKPVDQIMDDYEGDRQA
jgi:hypothetical protein